MRIDVITLFPQMFDAVTAFGVTGRAVKQGIVDVALWNPRNFSHNRHRTIDDRPYGGGPGMVMMAPPLGDAIEAAKAASGQKTAVIYLTPQGKRLNQHDVQEIASRPGMILLAGRYEGIDERLISSHVDEEYSIGDYVLSGGELAAMVLIDAVSRLLPGVLGHDESAQQDSFSDGLLDHPHYTRPESVAGVAVPNVLTSGDHRAIAQWRKKQAVGRTWQKRPDLLSSADLDAEVKQLLDEYIEEFEGHFEGNKK
ncbi:MAG: tRNA (guanosine(37)-N1)-methyltransferase TrmD [Gammaproteobacteria bacterium]|nr:tRNA (guanosine(37)-N1)-methyltransferase TrmD [Gammaproteobacteria bacterium]